jgi:two-component system, NtrC family, nitrogen regulation sensor histidine kinase NtrY
MTATRPHQPARWKRVLVAGMRRRRTLPRLEALAIALMSVAGIATWTWVNANSVSPRLLTAFVVVVLLLANLGPAIALIILLGRRVAHRRAAQSQNGTTGQLHVRLVALFSLVSAVPMVLMAIIASLLFQYGVDIWYSKRARQMFENTTALSQQLYAEKQQRVVAETTAMAGDMANALGQVSINSAAFANEFALQVYRRELSEGAIISITRENGVQSLALVNPYERPIENWVDAKIARQLRDGAKTVFGDTGKRMEAVAPLPGSKTLFLYASRVTDSETLSKAKRASLVLKDYNALIKRSSRLQIILNLALYAMSLLIVAAAVLVALRVADRLVRPVGELVDAARRVAAGDLTARVTPTRARDEVGVLSRAFNRMTERLGEQNRALVVSNELLDRRRLFTEAVLSSVTAGVIAVSRDHAIRLINPPASTLLKTGSDDVIGRPLKDFVPELEQLLSDKKNQGLVQVAQNGETKSLAVKIVRDELGFVLTFDDMTQQLMDQRRAAWSDVARRVAHEIKNPLTPIQLAAERLQRRFAKEVSAEGRSAFERLTETIVRQVGDLRRMVDEFSSFARMPKPVFAAESIVDIAREAMFLHEVANPSIAFKVIAPNPAPELVCDRRQLAQAISNVVKNGVEAIQQKAEPGSEAITLTIEIRDPGLIEVVVTDTGIGLPDERDRIIEPYMTTRPGGTGLGLAIVTKIIEEHLADIQFADRPGGGTCVTMLFDPAAVRAFDQSGRTVEAGDHSLTALTRKRKD